MIEEDDDDLYFAFGSGFRGLFSLLFRIAIHPRSLDWRYVGSALRMHTRNAGYDLADVPRQAVHYVVLGVLSAWFWFLRSVIRSGAVGKVSSHKRIR